MLKINNHSLASTASEENDPLQLLVVKEIVERPEASRLSVRIRIQIRIVAVDVTLVQVHLIIDGRPNGSP